VEPSRALVQTTPCAFRQVRWSFPSVDCLRCGGPAPRLWDAKRVAVDIDLDQPIVLAVVVSVHVCPVCSRMFRAQPSGRVSLAALPSVTPSNSSRSRTCHSSTMPLVTNGSPRTNSSADQPLVADTGPVWPPLGERPADRLRPDHCRITVTPPRNQRKSTLRTARQPARLREVLRLPSQAGTCVPGNWASPQSRSAATTGRKASPASVRR
jgi:hypothetical protein